VENTAVAHQAVGRLVLHFRLRAKLSQEDLSERSDLSVRAIRNIEVGVTRYPHVRYLLLIASALELDCTETKMLLTAVDRPLKGRERHANLAGYAADSAG
jgi:transcriptional regulator with XRE-family HTH domain